MRGSEGRRTDIAKSRARLVEKLAGPDCNIGDARVLAAMNKVPRHEFVPEANRSMAYWNIAVSIGHDQTISQPYIVALMTEELRLKPGDRVLEIGTGSGYQTAVLAELAAEVYTMEIIEPLAGRAQAELTRLGYGNIHFRRGDGSEGWPEAAPFDAIMVTCSPPEVPAALFEQLKLDGRLVIPLGRMPTQDLVLFHKTDRGIEGSQIIPVRFVPMTGEAESKN
jgi:protein-L-isoaspartate(D-aspartate) O-methyltransferase